MFKNNVKFVDSNFLPAVEDPKAIDALEHLKILLTHLVVGNKTNAEVVLCAYPKFFRELLAPTSPFFIHQFSNYIQITDETLHLSLQLYLEKISSSASVREKNNFAFSPNWYNLLTTLMADIEIPLLIWNLDTLEYLLKELHSLEESLNFARQLRLLSCSLPPLPLISTDTKRGIPVIWMLITPLCILTTTIMLSYLISSFIELLICWSLEDQNSFKLPCRLLGVCLKTLHFVHNPETLR